MIFQLCRGAKGVCWTADSSLRISPNGYWEDRVAVPEASLNQCSGEKHQVDSFSASDRVLPESTFLFSFTEN